MAWELTGNSGTNPTTDFVGTTDNQPLAIGINGTERVRVDTTGNVGIGTSAPGVKLEVSGGIFAHDTITATTATATNSTPEGGHLRVLNSSKTGTTATDWSIYNMTGGYGNGLAFWRYYADGTNAGPALFLTDMGNVGIGTNAPSVKLEVSGGIFAHDTITASTITATNSTPEGGRLRVLNSSKTGATANDWSIYNMTGGYGNGLAFWRYYADGTNPGSALFLADNGNVGVGTNVPGVKLEVSGGIFAHDTITATNSTPEGGHLRVLNSSKTGATANDWSIYNMTGGYGNGLAFWRYYADGTNPGPALFLTDVGNVGIGTSSPATKLHVNGDITVTGDVLLTGADCAEHFDIIGTQIPEPGTVVVIDEAGALRESLEPYDKKVAGVVSGAETYSPGLVLDNRPSGEPRVALALVGKVYCKVDAEYSPIEVGDLLTTSPTPGHAMKAMEPAKAFGSIIGKALRTLDNGKGLIPILIALQ